MFLNEKHKPLIESGDDCNTCLWAQKGQCPLIQALGLGFVELVDNVQIQGCGIYKKQLEVVKEHKEDLDILFNANFDSE